MTRYAFRHPFKRAAAGVLDAAGGLLFPPRARRAVSAPKNLLLVRLDHLGDAWNVTGLPKAVKEHFSGCRVACLVSSAAAPLFESNPFVDEILRFDAPWFWKKRKGPRLSRVTRELSRRGFDTALLPRGDIREHWLAFRAGVPRRIGPGITGGGFLLTDRVPWREEAHEMERISDAAECLGLPKKIWPPEIHFAEGERERLGAETDGKGLRRGGRFIGFQLEAGTPAKTWPVTHAARFLSLLLTRRREATAVLLGTDALRAEDVLGRVEMEFRSRILPLSGKFSLRELAAAANRFQLLVAPDSGPAHMLAWLGVPTVFLYSGTNRFESWKPMAEHAAALRQPVPCAPCGRRECNVFGHPCMSGIAPESVAQAVSERLR